MFVLLAELIKSYGLNQHSLVAAADGPLICSLLALCYA